MGFLSCADEQTTDHTATSNVTAPRGPRRALFSAAWNFKLQPTGKELFMKNLNTLALTICVLSALPLVASAQSGQFGPEEREREFSISGTGSSDRNLDSGNFGVTGDLGWYLQKEMVAGVRQSVNYASIEGESIADDFWNGSTRSYLNYHFLDDRARRVPVSLQQQ